MAGEPSNKRRSVRQAVTRKRSIYMDPDTDDDFAISEADSSYEGTVQPEATAHEPPSKKAKSSGKRSGRLPQRETRSKAAKKAAVRKSPPKHSSHKGKHISKPTKAIPVSPVIPSDGIIPKWQTLPYEILAQIFAYAFAAELETEYGTVASRKPHHPNTWIMRTSRRVCKVFAEPALTAFYQSPVLLANHQLDNFTALVKQSDESLVFKYRMKVKSLQVAAHCLEHQKGNHHQLTELVAHLPQLTELIITHPRDKAPFEYQGKSTRWKYSMALFDALDGANICLEKWRWNWHFMADTITGQPWHESSFGEFLNDIHSRPSFQRLRHLEISHLPSVPPFPELIESEEDPAGVVLAKAIRTLPNLKSLSFESCDCLTTQLLQGIPENLEVLKIVNCATLTSDMLYDCLSRNGSSNLTELVLDHNPFLDLAFLTSLQRLCPKLKLLRMDLFDHREAYFRHFGEPKYEQILLEDEVPTWPSTLQVLELTHLQKWVTGSAQNLFRSLVESAESLPDLRAIVLQAHISIAWRDRAAFRDQWIERLQRVFLRPDKAPDSRLASLKSWRNWKASQQPKPVKIASLEPLRQDVRVVVSPRRPSVATANGESTSDSDNSKRRSKRISDQAVLQEALLLQEPPEAPQPPKDKGKRRSGQSESGAISVISKSDNIGADEDWRTKPEKFVQGLCEIVDICIDNQRPREGQLHERDFVDSEASGDEEWTEGAEVRDNTYAW